MPPELSRDADAAAEWHRLVARCAQMQVLTQVDDAILAWAAVAYAVAVQSWRVLVESGTTYETVSTNGAPVFKKRPEAEIHADAWRRYHGALAQLGLTPAARGKVAAISQPEEADPADAYFN